MIEWVYIHSNVCSDLRKTHLFCNRVRIGRSMSSKVVDFGINRKGVCDFLLVINSNFGLNLAPFLNTATYWLKIEFFPYFSCTHFHLTPSLGVTTIEFLDELFFPKTRVLVLSGGKDFVIVARVVFTQCQRVTDGRTVGERDRRTSLS